MLRAQATGLIDYKTVCADEKHLWRSTAEPSLREEVAFEEVLRQAHVDNSIGQLTGLLAMMVTSEDRDLVAEVQDDIRQMTCPWSDKKRIKSADKIAGTLAFLAAQGERK
jgi:hypothetical protein